METGYQCMTIMDDRQDVTNNRITEKYMRFFVFIDQKTFTLIIVSCK